MEEMLRKFKDEFEGVYYLGCAIHLHVDVSDYRLVVDDLTSAICAEPGHQRVLHLDDPSAMGAGACDQCHIFIA